MVCSVKRVQFWIADLGFSSLGFICLLLSDTTGGGGVVGDEPVVDVEGDEEGGEAGDGDDIQYSGVVDQKKQAILKFEIYIYSGKMVKFGGYI